MGGPPATALRRRPARGSHLPRRDAHRRLHHPGVGDRSDPHAPSPARIHGRVRRRRSPVDPRTVRTGPLAPTRGGPPGPLSLTPTPRPHAGTIGVGGGPTKASDRFPLAPAPPRAPSSRAPSSGRPTGRARGAEVTSPLAAGARVAGDRAIYSPNTRPTSIGIPIPARGTPGGGARPRTHADHGDPARRPTRAGRRRAARGRRPRDPPADPARFDEYEDEIRAEYAWVPGPIFRSKRREVLRGFGARERI